jgi:hypothetical protein
MDRKFEKRSPIMERDEIHSWRKWDLVVNALLIAVVLFTFARVAWGFDTQDMTVEWTQEGKTLVM